MAVKITILDVLTSGQGDTIINGEMVLSGNYVTGGDICDFTQATADPDFQGVAPVIVSSLPPKQLDIWSMGGNIANGYFPILGALLTNCKIKITSAFNTELAAGAYPAGITGDDISFSLIVAKLL